MSKQFDEKNYLWVKGARLNNLKNVEVMLPKYKMIAVTGLSGSGKSSLIMDTIYAEGQRRYVESLSAYARQFLARMKKPEVDFIRGLAPAIAVEQKVVSGSSRSTVGSMTELYDLIRVLFARIGKTISPISGMEVKREKVADVVDFVTHFDAGIKLYILSPLNQQYQERPLHMELDIAQQKGFSRIFDGNDIIDIDDFLNGLTKKQKDQKVIKWLGRIQILIDRIVVKKDDEDWQNRVADSIQTAFAESEGGCTIQVVDGYAKSFSTRFTADGMDFLEPTPQLFNYNNPYGACKSCEGYGQTLGIDEDLVIPNDELTLVEGAIAPWNGTKGQYWLDQLILAADKSGIPLHIPYGEMEDEVLDLIWDGNEYFMGIHAYFDELQSASYKIQNRVILARYRGRTICRSCRGSRLRVETDYVKVGGLAIGNLIHEPIKKLKVFFDDLELTSRETEISKRLMYEIKNRLAILEKIGLGYLTLDRTAISLSGGETQRINLTRLLGSNLADSLYILDEPSIGLHPKDTDALIKVLHELRDLGNTVVVVEHEDLVIREADVVLDIGPGAGDFGGEILYSGTLKTFIKQNKTLTAKYLSGEKKVSVDKKRSHFKNTIDIVGASLFNVKHVDVSIPLHALTVMTGVSGSGKSSLVHGVIYPALRRALGLNFKEFKGKVKEIGGAVAILEGVEYISQRPVGRSSRSNPVTYVKAYDQIRKLFIKQPLSKMMGYKMKHFSFNVDGGRCETCKGDGEITVEMQFLADVKLTCESCQGKRFKDEILEIKYKGKNIFQILKMRVQEAVDFFEDVKEIKNAIEPLVKVGLGYVSLGQSSATLSGGEAQRLKLASYLGKEKSHQHQLFIFDEPTTGLHYEDVNTLLKALNLLIERGNTVLVVEHNMDFARNADYIIDLGPGGGDQGGKLVYQGSVEGIRACKESMTGKYI